MPLRFSVIIPNYNGRDLLPECLNSLAACRFPAEQVEWLVVDNGSHDGSVALVQERYPAVKVLALDINRGFTGAIQAGAEVASGEYLVLVNNDMRVSPDWLDAFDAVLDDITPCATGRIVSWGGDHIDFVGAILLFDGGALQRYMGAPVSTATPSAGETFIACGGNMAVKRTLFLELGGFDNHYFAYSEDVDFSWRLWAAGQRIVYVPEALTYHHQQATSSKLGIYRREFLYKRNAFMTLYKNIDPALFGEVLHATWLTVNHRSREVISLNAPESAIFGRDPYAVAAAPPAPTPSPSPWRRQLERSWRIAQRLPGLKRHIAQFQFHARQLGLRSALSRSLIRAGQAIAPRDIGSDAMDIAVDINHPPIHAQLQTLWYVLHHLERLHSERQRVQQQRRVPDQELFQRFPPWVVPTYPGDELLFTSAAFRSSLPSAIPYRFATLEEAHGHTPAVGDHPDL